MNTQQQLVGLLDREAADAPNAAALCRTVLDRVAIRQRRRRWTALGAATAAVVVIVGTVALVAGIHRAAPGTATAREVPIPAGSALIRYSTPDITSPVSAPKPVGWSGTQWATDPGHLTVTYFPLSNVSGSTNSQQVRGYDITNTKDETLYAPNAAGVSTRITPTIKDITVNGHRAVLSETPSGTFTRFGFNAERTFSWQLDNKQWIHVFGTSPAGALSSAALIQYAADITAKPQLLVPTVQPTLTMPGYTDMYTWSANEIDPYHLLGTYLCRPGTKPWTYTAGVPSDSHSCLAFETATATSAFPQLNSCSVHTVVDGQRVVVNREGGTKTAKRDDGDIVVFAEAPPTGPAVTSADIAALVAGARVPDNLPIAANVPGQVATGAVPTTSPSGTSGTAAGPSVLVDRTASASPGSGGQRSTC